jgi:hypothetical protein
MVMNPVMACQDKQIRVLNEDGKSLLYIHPFESACVCISMQEKLSERQSPVIGYGLSSGEVGVLELMRGKPDPLWSLDPSQI